MPTLFGGQSSDVTLAYTTVFSCTGRERNLTQCRNFTLPQCIHAGVYCFGKACTYTCTPTRSSCYIQICTYYYTELIYFNKITRFAKPACIVVQNSISFIVTKNLYIT